MKLQRNRQTIKTTFLILFFAGICLPMSGLAQNSETKIDYSNVDYSKKSNIINPDTLRGDQRKIFYHAYFLKLTSEKTENVEPLKIKEEFAKLGIETKENDRFLDAYSFFLSDVVSHKKSCEQWEYFKFLKPKSD